MIKKLFINLLIVSCFTSSHGQKATIDSLKELLIQHVALDTGRINLLNRLAYEIRRADYVKSYEYALEADSLSDRLNYLRGKAESQRMIARYYRSMGDYPKAMEYVQKALTINQEIGYKTGIAYCLGDISGIYVFLNNYTQAIEYSEKALEIAEEIYDNYQISLCYSNLGIIYQRMGDYPKALDYYQTGLKIAKSIHDKYSINAYLGNIGVIFQAQGNYPRALDYYQQSMQLCEESNDLRGVCYASANMGEIYLTQDNYTKALEHYQKALDLAEEIGDKYMVLSCHSLIGEIFIKQGDMVQALNYLEKGLVFSKEGGTKSITSQILSSIGTIHEKKNELPQALENYQKALKISEEINEKPAICKSYLNIGSVYLKLKKHQQALDYSLKSLSIARELKLFYDQSQVLLQLSEIYNATGDYQKAYYTYKTYKQVNDSVFNADNLKRITGLEYTYKYEKEKQVAELEQQKKDEVEAQKLRRQKYLFYSSGTVMLLVCFIAFLLFRNNHQQKKAYSELKATQAQLIQSEKMASLGEITAGIAHEIQNPLNFVNNFSELGDQLMDEMKEELQKGNITDAMILADDVKQNLQKISQYGKRADKIVKGMLQHSWAGSSHKEPTDINNLIDEFLRMCYHGYKAKDDTLNVMIETSYDETLSTAKGKVLVIGQEIGRVIKNLLDNAFFAVTDKKKRQPDGYEPTVSISTKKVGKKVEIRIRDNGSGIPQKIEKKIFQPFVTTKPSGQGTGLGLSISYDIIVHQHQGQISFKTEEDKFTEFLIQLNCNA